MTKSHDQELTTTTEPGPTDQAIVRRYRETIAKSSKNIQPGQAVFLDRHGRAYERSRFGRLVTAIKAGMYGSLLGGAALMFTGHPLPGALLYLLGFSPTIRSTYYGTGTLMAIEVLVREGQLEEGQRRLDAVPHLRRRNRVSYFHLAGNLASHRGDYALAISHWREALGRAKDLRRELLKLGITKALLLSGQAKEARLVFDTVTLPPESDDILTSTNLARVMFVLCDPSSEPMSDEELHDRARRALEYSHTGVDLAAIGWAFERNGDEEMATFLATEARERMHYPYLATWWPALQQWLDGRAPQVETPDCETPRATP